MRRIRLIPLGLIPLAIQLGLASAACAADTTVAITYLEEARPVVQGQAALQPVPADQGRAGAELAIKENDTTGKFLHQTFRLSTVTVDGTAPAADTLAKLSRSGARLVVMNVSAVTIHKLAAAPGWKDYLWFNAGDRDDALRQSACQPNLLHTLPGRAMSADALGQYLVSRRWAKWFLVSGPTPEDARYAAAVRRAAKRFGARIVAEKTWSNALGGQRTAQGEVPVFTQVSDYDVLVVADERDDFGDYLPYRTWLPRPVAGTQGLVATGWHASAEQWGATQLQNRFLAAAKRPMNEVDFAAWAAVRSVGEAATRLGSGDPKQIAAYIRGPAFQLAAFKGRNLSYRPWNGELRQPMLVAQPNALVSMSPQDGFMNPKTDLDTLGFDQSEVSCKAT